MALLRMHVPKLKARHFCLLFVLLAVVIYLFQPDRSGRLVDTDEALTAIRALLYHQGFKLHEQVWSDQPALLSVIYSWTLYFLGPNLEAGRLIVILFGSLLATSLAFIVYRDRGILAALCVPILLLASTRFLRLSGALMIGVPALAFAASSLALLVASGGARLGLVALSGAAFACGTGCKLFVILIGPAIAVHFGIQLWSAYRAKLPLRPALVSPIVWGGAFLLTACLLAAVFSPALLTGYAQQLFSGHSKMREGFKGDNLRILVRFASEDTYIFALAGLGSCCAVIYRRAEYIIPLVWLAVAAQFLRNHHPLWVHHYLLYSVPAVWLAALAVSEIWSSPAVAAPASPPEPEPGADSASRAKGGLLRRYVILPALCLATCWAIALVPIRLAAKTENLAEVGMVIRERLLRRVEQLKPSITWMVSDAPVYPYLLGIRVIPELGLIPRKRITSGALSPEQMAAIIQQYKPEVILVERFPKLRDRLLPLLGDTYVVDMKEKGLLIRSDIVPPEKAKTL